MATTDELYTAIQQFKLYIQQNFPFKQTVFEGTADPTAGAGVSAPIGAFYAQKDGSGNLLKLWLKKTAVATNWEDVGAGGTGSGVLLWTPNTPYTTFADAGVPALVWEPASEKFYHNLSDFTSSATFAADQLLGRWTELGGGANPLLPIGTWDMTGALTPATLSATIIPPPYDQFVTNEVILAAPLYSVSTTGTTITYGLVDMGTTVPATGKYYMFWSPGQIVGLPTTVLNQLTIGDPFSNSLFKFYLAEGFGLLLDVPGGTLTVDAAFVADDVMALEFDLATGVVGVVTPNVDIPDLSVLDLLLTNLNCSLWPGEKVTGAIAVAFPANTGTTVGVSARFSSTDNFGLVYTPPVDYLTYGYVGDGVPPVGVVDGNRFRVIAPGTYGGESAETNDLVEFRNNTANIFVYKAPSNVINQASLDAALVVAADKLTSTMDGIKVQNIYNSSADQPTWTAADVGNYFMVGNTPSGDFAAATSGDLAKVTAVNTDVPSFTFTTPNPDDRIFYIPTSTIYIYAPGNVYYPAIADQLTDLNWIHDSSHPKYQGLERWNAVAPINATVDDILPDTPVYINNDTQYHRISLVANNTSLPANLYIYFNGLFTSTTLNAPTTGTVEIELSGSGSQPLTVFINNGGPVPTKGSVLYDFSLTPPNFSSFPALLLEYRITNGTLAIRQIYPTPAPNIPVVTTDYNGLMSAQDKGKLDNLDDSTAFGSAITSGLPDFPLMWSGSFTTPDLEANNDEVIFAYQSNGAAWRFSHITRSTLLESATPSWTTYSIGSQLVKKIAYSPDLDVAIGIGITGSTLVKFSGFNNNLLTNPSTPTIPLTNGLKDIVWVDAFKAFVATSSDTGVTNKVLYSTDGDTWTSAVGTTNNRYLATVEVDDGLVSMYYNGSNTSFYLNNNTNWQASFPGTLIATSSLSAAFDSHSMAINKYGTIAASDNVNFKVALIRLNSFYREVSTSDTVTRLEYSKDFNCFIAESSTSTSNILISAEGDDWFPLRIGDGTATNQGLTCSIQGTPYISKWTAPALTLNTFKYGNTVLINKADFRANKAIAPVLRLIEAPLHQVDLMTSKDGWTDIALQNSWVNGNSTGNAIFAATRKNENRVDIVLSITAGTTTGIGSVPVDCRPTSSLRLPAVVQSAGSGLIYHGHIYIDGTDGGIQLIMNGGDFVSTDIKIQLNTTYFILPTV